MAGGGCQSSSAVVLDVMLNNNIVGLSEGAGEKEAGEKRRGMGEGGWWNVRGEEEKKAGEEQMEEGRRGADERVLCAVSLTKYIRISHAVPVALKRKLS